MFFLFHINLLKTPCSFLGRAGRFKQRLNDTQILSRWSTEKRHVFKRHIRIDRLVLGSVRFDDREMQVRGRHHQDTCSIYACQRAARCRIKLLIIGEFGTSRARVTDPRRTAWNSMSVYIHYTTQLVMRFTHFLRLRFGRAWFSLVLSGFPLSLQFVFTLALFLEVFLVWPFDRLLCTPAIL